MVDTLRIVEIAIYFTSFLLLVSTLQSYSGIVNTRLFASREKKRNSLVWWCTFLALLAVLVHVSTMFFLGENHLRILVKNYAVEIFLWFCVVVLVTLGNMEVSRQITHGKKYRANFRYFGLALFTALLTIVYLNFVKSESSFF